MVSRKWGVPKCRAQRSDNVIDENDYETPLQLLLLLLLSGIIYSIVKWRHNCRLFLYRLGSSVFLKEKEDVSQEEKVEISPLNVWCVQTIDSYFASPRRRSDNLLCDRRKHQDQPSPPPTMLKCLSTLNQFLFIDLIHFHHLQILYCSLAWRAAASCDSCRLG